MVMIVWFILSLFGVCSFTWLPVLIDTGLYTIYAIINLNDDRYLPNAIGTLTLGVAGFSFYKFFFDLSISTWWIFLSPIAFPVMVFFPGGLTITNLIFSHYGLMELPTWGLIVGIVIDVFFLIALVLIIVDAITNRKSR